MKNCSTKEYYTDFGILPFSTIYSFEDRGDRLAMLSKWIFDNITCHAPLKQAQQINKFLARNSLSKENRMNFLNFRNDLKEKRKRYRNIT